MPSHYTSNTIECDIFASEETVPGHGTGQPGQHSGQPGQPGQHSGQPGQPSGQPGQPGQHSGPASPTNQVNTQASQTNQVNTQANPQASQANPQASQANPQAARKAGTFTYTKTQAKPARWKPLLLGSRLGLLT